MVSWAIRTLVLATALLLPIVASAQTASPPAAAGSPQLLKPEQLDQLVAPIALYPDPLLAEVLMASAYPLDIVEAERWLQANKKLKGDELKAALEKQDWDDSVKSLVATPSVLEMMSSKLDWTQKLGDAVVAQQPDVMDAIQRLRAKAQANNKLTSTKQQTVTVDQVQGKQVIAIEPTDPDTVYVPYYDPAVVYGAWPYPDYPPYYWEPPYYIGAGLLAAGLAFGAGYALANWGGYWRGGVNWSGGGNNIIVNPPGNRPGLKPSNPIANAGNRWQPRVEHRQAAGNRGNRQQLNFRGTGGQQVLKPGAKPGGGRENLGNRGEGNRPNKGANVAHRGQTNRPSANARPTQRAAKSTQRAARPTQRAAGGARHHAAARNRGPARAAHVGARGGRPNIGGGGMRARGGGGGGGMRARGGGGGGRGRRSDIRLKHDIVLLGHLENGLGFYRFSYNGSDKAYVGVIAQEVQQVSPQAVTRGHDGYLRVNYDALGVKFESYREWLGSGAKIP
jgi:hypothetical protein